MKYQVYLNKETSKLVERIATVEGIKPNTLIKKLIEGIMTKASEAALNMSRDVFSLREEGLNEKCKK